MAIFNSQMLVCQRVRVKNLHGSTLPCGSQALKLENALLRKRLQHMEAPCEWWDEGYPNSCSWMVYSGKSIYKWMILGVPLFQETSR